MSNLTLGSLFDGSGGFPLGGLLCGITPLWAAEIEPFPIRVTTRRLPWMRHLGDVRAIHGDKITPVDIITFGSPCTDLSIAGLRAGLDGKQSGLFYQAIRIIREMRCATHGRYPRYIVWENVPGAFSSNKGGDFRAVLEEICKVKSRTFSVPQPEKWSRAGTIVADGFSLAWRVLDARYWGVPQRRRRIYLVADFDGQCAGKILFESESLSQYSASGFQTWQEAAGHPSNRAGVSGAICLNDQGGQYMDVSEEVVGTLRSRMEGHPPCVMFENHSQDTRYTGPLDTAPTVSATYGTGGNNQPLVQTYDIRFTSEGTQNTRANVYQTDTSRTIDCGGNAPDSNQGGVAVVKTYAITSGNFTQIGEEQSPALMARDFKDPISINAGRFVRRLMPMECARLQGFPDWWCSNLDTANPTEAEIAFWFEVFETHRKAVGTSSRTKGRKQIIRWLRHPHSDAAEYKMWGNGVALPCVFFVLAGIVWSAQSDPQLSDDFSTSK